MKRHNRIGTLPRSSFLLALAVSGALLSGCSSKPKASPEPTEIPLGDVTAVDTPEEQLFAEAKNYYATELYSVARESFKSLATSYALGAYAEFAEIKAADSYFEMNEFDTARGMYEEFMKSRPASRSLPYVTMRAGRSFHLSHRGIGRDPQSLERALELYDTLINRYPSSIYADSARIYRNEVLRDLERSERVVADFYARRSNQRAVSAREELIAQKWTPLIAVADTAPPRGVEVARYMPEMAVNLPAAAPIVPPVSRDGVSSSTTQTAEEGGIKVVRAICKEGPPEQIFLHLSDAPTRPVMVRELTAASGQISFNLPGVSSKGLALDCLGQGDLAVTKDGTVTLKSSAAGGNVRVLQNPARVLLVLNR